MSSAVVKSFNSSEDDALRRNERAIAENERTLREIGTIAAQIASNQQMIQAQVNDAKAYGDDLKRRVRRIEASNDFLTNATIVVLGCITAVAAVVFAYKHL